ncbi:hypothetical protein [Thermococcus sp. MV11]|uniref:hypothetical protein n=1 Tax=Thermococcus sp. MV11 TaxID=1638267 RepID=UPI001980BE3B|nr:hypothetical protein [Thermococcus sp. MV11]
MLKSRRRRRGQTAIEVLFIVGIILTGIALMTPGYIKESDTATVVAYVKNSAASACAYLNSGVTTDRYPQRILNAIITESNYTYKAFRVVGVTSSESKDTITVGIIIEYSGKIDLGDDAIAGTIRAFIISDLAESGNARLVGDTLYYGGREVVIVVSVVRA